MWTLLPPRLRVMLVVSASMCVLVFWFGIDSYRNEGDWGPTWSWLAIRLFSATGIVTIVGGVLGPTQWAWTLPAKLRLTAWLYPSLAGVWQGQVFSNSDAKGASAMSTPIKMKIRQTWQKIEVSVVSDSGYSESKSELVHPSYVDGEHLLWTIFRGAVPRPEETDEQHFVGTSRIKYNSEKDSLEGVYWTNRAWFKDGGRNTAGYISLTRLNAG